MQHQKAPWFPMQRGGSMHYWMGKYRCIGRGLLHQLPHKKREFENAARTSDGLRSDQGVPHHRHPETRCNLLVRSANPYSELSIDLDFPGRESSTASLDILPPMWSFDASWVFDPQE